MTIRGLASVLAIAAALFLMVATTTGRADHQESELKPDVRAPELNDAVTIGYLEIVTPDVEATCALLTAVHDIRFSDAVPEFGNARTASLGSGGRIGVRAPLRQDEQPVVRPYVLVDDIETAVEMARVRGGEIAIPPMLIPGQGTFAIYLLGGIEHGLWQE